MQYYEPYTFITTEEFEKYLNEKKRTGWKLTKVNGKLTPNSSVVLVFEIKQDSID